MALQKKKAGVAQLAEHQPSKLRVTGSKPVSRSSDIKGLRRLRSPFSFCLIYISNPISNLAACFRFSPNSAFSMPGNLSSYCFNSGTEGRINQTPPHTTPAWPLAELNICKTAREIRIKNWILVVLRGGIIKVDGELHLVPKSIPGECGLRDVIHSFQLFCEALSFCSE